ncbi:MAG: hypothetical protein KKD01_19675 [Proteobacteria bacterium]|nr:hypothetical protein [Pseudomonadota bacterium]MBU1456941.1 hypothetical protein [Pseudomonadota bacterium]
MTGLSRTDLSTSHKAHLAASAYAGQGTYGTKSALARKYEVSRPTVYAAGETGQAVMEQHFARVEEGDEVVWVKVDRMQLKRAVVALRVVAPDSIRAIEALVPIVYPGLKRSYGWIQGICVEAEAKAAEFNKQVNLSAVQAGALDEMFSQGDPVLAGVDLDSSHLFSLALREHRGKDDWAEVLRLAKDQGMELRTVVKDAALGIAAGVTAVYPEADQRDDCFHAKYETGKVRRRLEQKAYGAIHREMETEQAVDKASRKIGGNVRKAAGQLAPARKKCREAIERHDAFERAAKKSSDAMEFVDLETGHLRNAEEIQTGVESAATEMQEIAFEPAQKVGKYLANRASGLARYMEVLGEQLQEIGDHFGHKQVVLACIIWQLLAVLRGCTDGIERHRHQRHLAGAFAMLRDLAGEDARSVFQAVDLALLHRHRASSAIEGFNAALRPFLYVHKGVTQGFLSLFQAHYNLRTRRWGRHKGTSAHEQLTGERVDDWLTVLGYPPSTAVQ